MWPIIIALLFKNRMRCDNLFCLSCLYELFANSPPRRLTILRYVGLFLFSFFLLSFLSLDSFLTHLCTYRCDSAWFFTCGKAWMEGLTPYVDFSDSKGLLLWLIYGIGYLLSPTSYLGVFWLSILAYTVTFDVVWRTARLFVGRRESLLVLVMMPALMFYGGIHDEVRAEDFCLVGICTGIYCTCQALISSKGLSVKRYAFGLGASMAWCLLMKWNLFVLMGGMALVVLGVSFIRRRVDALLFGLLGVAALTLPFVMYLLLKGCFTDMVQEYLVNTFQISGHRFDSGIKRTVFYTLSTSSMSVRFTVMMLGAFLGMLLFCRRFRVTYWLVLIFVPTFLFLEFKPSWCHYFAIVTPFCIFFLLAIVGYCSRWIDKCPKSPFLLFVICFCLITTFHNTRWGDFVFFPSKEQQQWDEIQSVLQRKHQPRILVGIRDNGFGVPCRALPACKYWALQTNPLHEMIEERRQAIRAQKPDFVVIASKGQDADIKDIESRDSMFFTVLRESGYRQCYVAVKKNGKTLKKAVPVYAKE